MIPLTETPIEYLDRMLDVQSVDGKSGPVHLYCCDRDRALCDKDISGEAFVAANDPTPECESCADFADAGLPCGAWLCRIRQAWRTARGRGEA